MASVHSLSQNPSHLLSKLDLLKCFVIPFLFWWVTLIYLWLVFSFILIYSESCFQLLDRFTFSWDKSACPSSFEYIYWWLHFLFFPGSQRCIRIMVWFTFFLDKVLLSWWLWISWILFSFFGINPVYFSRVLYLIPKVSSTFLRELSFLLLLLSSFSKWFLFRMRNRFMEKNGVFCFFICFSFYISLEDISISFLCLSDLFLFLSLFDIKCIDFFQM